MTCVNRLRIRQWATGTLAVVAMGVVGVAGAATVNLDQGAAGPSDDTTAAAKTVGAADEGYLTRQVSGAFTDNWYFNLTGPSASSSVASFQFNPVYSITGFSATVYSCSAHDGSVCTSQTVEDSGSGSLISLDLTGAALYHLVVTGTATTGILGGLYSASVKPVPLPAAGWLMLSGLLGLGAVARRRIGVNGAATTAAA